MHKLRRFDIRHMRGKYIQITRQFGRTIRKGHNRTQPAAGAGECTWNRQDWCHACMNVIARGAKPLRPAHRWSPPMHAMHIHLYSLLVLHGHLPTRGYDTTHTASEPSNLTLSYASQQPLFVLLIPAPSLWPRSFPSTRSLLPFPLPPL